jgi:hypothetical protein
MSLLVHYLKKFGLIKKAQGKIYSAAGGTAAVKRTLIARGKPEYKRALKRATRKVFPKNRVIPIPKPTGVVEIRHPVIIPKWGIPKKKIRRT